MQRIRLKAALVAGVAAVLLGACAATPPGQKPKTLEQKLDDKGYELGKPVDRIVNWTINGWGYIDDEHVVFSAGVSRDYLVTLLGPCNDLSSATTIGFTAMGSEVTRFDKLITRNMGFSQQCPIRELHELKRLKKKD
ncbi:DUF6491 family protein [Solimonas flava]|uniref:DUF6491 family protein n=1 Tax=Solimonas flava TaxID=415849 RepID=UPI0003FC4E7F|nr:DUF6491 family protein [Solimonas flava]